MLERMKGDGDAAFGLERVNRLAVTLLGGHGAS